VDYLPKYQNELPINIQIKLLMYNKMTIFNKFKYKITKHQAENDRTVSKICNELPYKNMFKKLPLVFQLEWRVLQQLKQ